MTSIAHPSRPFSLRRTVVALALALALALAALAAAAAPASAAPATGEVVLSLKAGAGSSLQGQGVTLSYGAKQGKSGSAKKRLARPKGKKGGRARTLRLRVSDLSTGQGTTTLEIAGRLAFGAEGRRVLATRLSASSRDEETTVSGRLGGKDLVLFRAKGKARKVDSFTIKLSGARLSLTGRAASAIGGALGHELAGGHVGALSIDASLEQPAPAPKGPEVPAPPKEEEKPDPGIPYPYEAECPVSAVQGAPTGFGHAPGTIAGILPAPIFDPALSQPVTGSGIEWGFKNSFREYALTIGKPGSLQTLDGATATPNGADMAAAGSYFGFPVASGTYEAGGAPGNDGDKLVAEGSGTVLLCKSGHGFSWVIKNPTVTIEGLSGQITADVGVNTQGTWYGFQRVDLATLDLTTVDPTLSDGGNSIAWDDVPVKLSADGASALGDPYAVNTPLDPITIETAVERPLQAECAIDEGTASTLPTIDFTQADLPNLVNPVTMSGDDIGTINWGFRRATRSTANTAGHFALLGGATKSHADMGGGTSMNPGPGLGKFFRFPVSSYEYEVGTADPSDDRLIASSDATVGFCTLTQGMFGVVISKPTLVIDGDDSRIVANAYSYQGGNKGWVGGRVDLVELDGDAVPAVTGSGAVKWGDIAPNEQKLEAGMPPETGLLTEVLSVANLTMAGTALNPPTNPSGGWDPVAARIALPDEPYPYEAQCAVDNVSGGPPTDAPGEVVRTAPLPAFNPGTSQEVTGIEIDWGVHDSFRDYVINGLGVPGSVQALDGAEAVPGPGAPMAGANAYVKFPADGTYEPGSAPGNAADRLVADGTGTVLLCKPGHGFNLAIKNPTVVIDGDNSRIVADVGINENQVWHPYQRVDVAKLELGSVTPTITEGGNSVTWTDVPAKLTADGALAGFAYPAGEILDTVTVKTTLARPLTECGISIGTGTTPRPAVDFTKAALPTLNDPVTRTGTEIGTINWGFRRSTRATVAASGSFFLKGGATASYPNMGGGTTPAPTGGEGKFFRFPVSSYQYDDGEPANLKDDRLIATSEATVGFCNPGAGQTYAVVISRPTLVIDGVNSRIVANAYSLKAPSQGWIGGRVELVKLDPSAVDAIAGAGTVTWGEVTADEVPLTSGIPVSGALLTNALSLANLTPASTATGWDQLAARIALPTP